MKPHIVVINDLAEPMGGASKLAVESALAFARRGHAVTFIAGGSDSDLLGAAGIEVVSLQQKRLVAAGFSSSVLRGLYNRAARDMLAAWIAQNDHEGMVYHLHGWAQILSPSIFVPLRKVADRLVLSAHDFFVTCPNGAMFDFRQQERCELQPLGTRCLMRDCDRRNRLQKGWRVARHSVLARTRPMFDRFPPVLLIHEGMRRYLAMGGIEDADMAVLPNPVSPYCSERVEAEKNSSALFVGRIEPTKGIAQAAEACRRAGVRLIAVGTGSLLAELAERYPEHDWVGWTPPSEIGHYAARARVQLMPSIAIEPFGLTAVEALWSGLPVLCSENALLLDEIETAGAGRGIDPTDIDEFARILSIWAQKDALVRGMSINAFEGTRGIAMTADAWIDRLIESYQALLEGGKRRLVALYDEPARDCRGKQGSQTSPARLHDARRTAREVRNATC